MYDMPQSIEITSDSRHDRFKILNPPPLLSDEGIMHDCGVHFIALNSGSFVLLNQQTALLSEDAGLV